jgi:hypothetical protein
LSNGLIPAFKLALQHCNRAFDVSLEHVRRGVNYSISELQRRLFLTSIWLDGGNSSRRLLDR